MASYYTVQDPLNNNKTRNLENTHRSDYNCGGYALGTFTWYIPYPAGISLEEFATHRNCMNIDDLIDACVAYMIEEFQGELRQIAAEDELRAEENLVLFRMEDTDDNWASYLGEGDFHYVLRDSRGIYSHKRGGTHEIWEMSKNEAYDIDWCEIYDSRIVLLALRAHD